MEAQMQRPAHQQIEQDAPLNVGLHSGESNQTGEKKSVMKKVKDKARKLKDTLRPSQGHGQEHEYRYDENVDEEDDDDDEEIANDREIHAPDSSVDHTQEDRIDPMTKGEAKARPNIPAQTGYDHDQTPENQHFPSPTMPVTSQREEDNAGESKVKLGPSMGLEKDAQFGAGDAPSNYESKVSNPTGDGGKDAGVGPLIRRFDHLNVGDESETKAEPGQKEFTGSHNQFSPTVDQSYSESNPESQPKNFDSNETEGMPRDTITGKASSALTDKAIYAKNVVASKLGYGGGSGQEGISPSKKPESESTPGYTQRITDTLNPVYEKVAGAGTAVMSKFQGGGAAGNQAGGGPGNEDLDLSDKPESEPAPGYTKRIADTLNPVYDKVAGAGTAVMSKFQGSGGGGDAATTGTDKGVSVKDYWTDKLKPGDEDKALSEAITDALHKKKEGYLQKPGEEKPTGKVNEVEGEEAFDAGRESSGPGVVGRVKDAVGSWIGKGTGTQPTQDSVKDSYVDKSGEQAKLQE